MIFYILFIFINNIFLDNNILWHPIYIRNNKYFYFYKIINFITKKNSFLLEIFLFNIIYFIDIINNTKIFIKYIINLIYIILLLYLNNIIKNKNKVLRPFLLKFSFFKKNIINISSDFKFNKTYSFPSNHSLICNMYILNILNNIKYLKYSTSLYNTFILIFLINMYSRFLMGMHHINDIKFYINFSIVLFYLLNIILNKYLYIPL
ncbi:phosphatase PAP2 family protein [Candidatus Nardonella dryophthoridicola]|uniref:Membrane-associated phospholipid phosphatase n=1 Tax=endosymbiont of Rhynchophorus ferrugineus TaxID=1972133 RepID=A0A2Z5T3N7_9GAMM|nr:phosphatase PAP2 family protein [Candidatus Nardonella dryophthoridicola]BBA85010.1 membrane-associated phospholipid phosphatase [endosymbiont of Rhynchophorus ferrugineus]